MDESPDVTSEITLDDFNADEQPPAKADPSPVPEPVKDEEKAEVEEPKEEIAPPEVPTKEDTDKAEGPEETPEEKPKKAEERKAQLNTEIRDLVAQRNAIRAEVEAKTAEVYQPATEQELTEQGMTALEAKVESMRQASEMERYNSQIAEAQLTISHESSRVLNEFPMFNPESEQYEKDLAEEAAGHLDANLIRDPNTNQVIGTNPGFSPYNYYKLLARVHSSSSAKGQIQAQADTETQLANADENSSNAPPAKAKTAEDELLAMWKSDD